MINEIHDKMAKDVDDKKNEVNTSIDDDIATIDEYLVLIENINTNKTENNFDDVTEDLKMLQLDIITQIKGTISKERSYQYFQYFKGDLTPKMIEQWCGHLTHKETRVQLSKLDAKFTGRK